MTFIGLNWSLATGLQFQSQSPKRIRACVSIFLFSLRQQMKWFSMWSAWASTVPRKLEVCDRQMRLLLSPGGMSLLLATLEGLSLYHGGWKRQTSPLEFWQCVSSLVKKKERKSICKHHRSFPVCLWEGAHRDAPAIFWPQRITMASWWR